MFKRIAITAALLIVASESPARLIESWPYKKLFEQAEVVVIAKSGKTEDTKDKQPKHDWNCEFIGQNTTFKIEHVLKGKDEEKEIQVLHFRVDKGDLIDGPLFVTFRTEPLNIPTKTAKRKLDTPCYMLFLKKNKDGRYEPVSGQIDPVLSVKEISEPLDFDLDEKK